MEFRERVYRAPALATLALRRMVERIGSKSGQSPGQSLARLFADERAFSWRMEPLAASAEGVRSFDDRLASVTPAAQER